MVERQLPKLNVAGSIPVSRSGAETAAESTASAAFFIVGPYTITYVNSYEAPRRPAFPYGY